MTATTPDGFRGAHPGDRNFFLAALGLIWLVILAGFIPDVLKHVAKHHGIVYPFLVHVHAAAFVGWLVLFTAQVGLIRTRHVALHRKLGVFGVVLAAAMVVLGPAAGIVTERINFGTPDSDPAFLSIEFVEMIVFALQVGAAVALRGNAAAHKRLMLLSTLFLTSAGFGRFAFDPIHAVLGDGFWPFLVELNGGVLLLVAGLGLYDLLTRGRLHPAYVFGAGVGVIGQLIGAFLYYIPWCRAITLRIIGH